MHVTHVACRTKEKSFHSTKTLANIKQRITMEFILFRVSTTNTTKFSKGRKKKKKRKNMEGGLWMLSNPL